MAGDDKVIPALSGNPTQEENMAGTGMSRDELDAETRSREAAERIEAGALAPEELAAATACGVAHPEIEGMACMRSQGHGGVHIGVAMGGNVTWEDVAAPPGWSSGPTPQDVRVYGSTASLEVRWIGGVRHWRVKTEPDRMRVQGVLAKLEGTGTAIGKLIASIPELLAAADDLPDARFQAQIDAADDAEYERYEAAAAATRAALAELGWRMD